MTDPMQNLSRLLNEGGTVREVLKIAPYFGCVTASMRRAIALGHFDVHLPPATVRRLLTKPDLGGRPPQPFWDDLLMHVFRRLYVDGWEPRSQADIVEAMEHWLLEKGAYSSEAPLVIRARMIWKTLELRPKS